MPMKFLFPLFVFNIIVLRKVGAFIFCQAEPDLFGGIAQLGEHLPCKQGVSGSIPLTSTITVKAVKVETVKTDRSNKTCEQL